jgi:hypothetical protein
MGITRLRGRFPSPALILSCLALFAALGGSTYAATSNSGASSRVTLQHVNIAAPAFVARDYSVHNHNGLSVCGSFVAHNGEGGENGGDLDNGGGSYLAYLRLPQGATVRSFSLLANDFDNANDVHAYLIRKKIANNLTPKSLGYKAMASASSSGAVNDVMREFTDSSVTGSVIDNATYMYQIELVVCPVTEPFAVRITYTGTS